MHSSQLQDETAQPGNTKQRRTCHDERSETTAAQQQQHSNGGDVGGPEEAPLVAPATSPFLVCITKSHGAASTPLRCEWSHAQRKVDRSVA